MLLSHLHFNLRLLKVINTMSDVDKGAFKYYVSTFGGDGGSDQKC